MAAALPFESGAPFATSGREGLLAHTDTTPRRALRETTITFGAADAPGVWVQGLLRSSGHAAVGDLVAGGGGAPSHAHRAGSVFGRTLGDLLGAIPDGLGPDGRVAQDGFDPR